MATIVGLTFPEEPAEKPARKPRKKAAAKAAEAE
mgnify:FL=1